jgi:hypothetical protein
MSYASGNPASQAAAFPLLTGGRRQLTLPMAELVSEMFHCFQEINGVHGINLPGLWFTRTFSANRLHSSTCIHGLIPSRSRGSAPRIRNAAPWM